MAQLLMWNTDSIFSYQRDKPTTPSVPLKFKACFWSYVVRGSLSDTRRDSSKSKENKVSMVLRVVLQKMKCCEMLHGKNEYALMAEMETQYTRRARIAQSSALPPVADEPASPLRDVSQGKACPTDSGFEADQDKATIAKTSNLHHDSAPRVTSSISAEGIKERSGDDAPIKERNLDEGEAVTERVSDDTEEMETVLTSMDAATVLASEVAEVPTGSDVVPNASPVFATATVVTPYRRRKVAKELEEQLEREDQRMSEQIARDAEVARIHFEEELQSMIDGLDRSNETVAKYLQEYQQFTLELPLERRIELISNLVRGMTFEEIEAKFTTDWKQIEDFIPMGSKEEVERLKRKGLSLDQESVKKLKTSEEVIEEAKSPDEVSEEKNDKKNKPSEMVKYDTDDVVVPSGFARGHVYSNVLHA
nr:hypothetical protein [Tanacetum cinerariifolium]